MTDTDRVALALVGALALAACAPGGSPPRNGERGGPGAEAAVGGLIVTSFALLLTEFDADGDRRVTRDELAAGVAAAWIELDTDRDGSASPFEFVDWSRAAIGLGQVIPGRVAFDRNADGQVTPAEFEAMFGAEFARLDANGDGAVERAELVRRAAPAASPRRQAPERGAVEVLPREPVTGAAPLVRDQR
jgi:hypothetical protein